MISALLPNISVKFHNWCRHSQRFDLVQNRIHKLRTNYIVYLISFLFIGNCWHLFLFVFLLELQLNVVEKADNVVPTSLIEMLKCYWNGGTEENQEEPGKYHSFLLVFMKWFELGSSSLQDRSVTSALNCSGSNLPKRLSMHTHTHIHTYLYTHIISYVPMYINIHTVYTNVLNTCTYKLDLLNYLFIQRSRFILEKLTDSQLVRISPHIMEAKRSLPHLHEPASCFNFILFPYASAVINLITLK
jgi:hypothetical protein